MKKRKKPRNRRKWKKIMPLLGKHPDSVLAREFKIPSQYIARKRRSLGISRYASATAVEWDEVGLGTMPDEDLAELLTISLKQKISEYWVTLERRKRGILTFNRSLTKIDWDEIPLGEVPDLRIAQQLGIRVARVWRARTARNIRVAPRVPRGQDLPIFTENPPEGS